MLKTPKLPKIIYNGDRIAFIGPMATGKTFYSQYLVDYWGYNKHSLAAKLKAIAYEMFDVQGKDGQDRLILQGIGSDFRKYDKDVWVKYLLLDLERNLRKNKYYKVVVDDLRYENEAKYFRDNGFTLIRIATPEVIRSERIARLYPNRPPEAAQHASETEQEGIKADYVIKGNDLGLTEGLDALIYELRDSKSPLFV